MKQQSNIAGQASLFPEISFAGCGNCLCKECVYFWSGRCPHGSCYDDQRAAIIPYDKAHPGKPPRTLWSNWESQQAWWCRGGIFYPAQCCERYAPNEPKPRVEYCLEAPVAIYADGYINCAILDCGRGCEYCYERLMEKLEDE